MGTSDDDIDNAIAARMSSSISSSNKPKEDEEPLEGGTVDDGVGAGVLEDGSVVDEEGAAARLLLLLLLSFFAYSFNVLDNAIAIFISSSFGAAEVVLAGALLLLLLSFLFDLPFSLACSAAVAAAAAVSTPSMTSAASWRPSIPPASFTVSISSTKDCKYDENNVSRFFSISYKAIISSFNLERRSRGRRCWGEGNKEDTSSCLTVEARIK